MVAAAAVLPFALLAGCAQAQPSSVAPGDGPAATDGPVEGEPGGEPSGDPSESASPDESPTANFGEKYTYGDGIQVEVIKIKLGKITSKQREAFADEKVGTPYQVLTVRVKNGTDKKLTDVTSSFTLTYGPDGDTAETTYVPKEKTPDISGTILPGKAKVAGQSYAMPVKYLDGVQLEFQFDYEHAATIFSGSLKN